MPYYSKKEYKLLGFEKSTRKNKKYNAILQNKKTGRQVRVPFGDVRYQQYKDTTGLGLYSHKDHGDKKRRASYKARHSVYVQDGYYSPGFFSMRYLW